MVLSSQAYKPSDTLFDHRLTDEHDQSPHITYYFLTSVAVGSPADKAGRSMALEIIRRRGGPVISPSRRSRIATPMAADYPAGVLSFVHQDLVNSCAGTGSRL
ncbi:hypothetical protein MY10362_000938 [Beauveria mimosiformis]